MSDALLLGVWAAILLGGLGAVVAAHRLGLPRTLARDALHVGAGCWVLGWPWWASPAWPIAVTVAALGAVAITPGLAPRLPPARALVRAVSGDDERWGGIVAYTLSFAVFTTVGLLAAPAASATALWALCLGDGLGGLVGRRWGRRRYRVPGAKAKSVEGSLVVALGGVCAALLAGWWFASPIPLLLALGVGVAASVAEALSPRASDNLLVPLVAFVVALLAR